LSFLLSAENTEGEASMDDVSLITVVIVVASGCHSKVNRESPFWFYFKMSMTRYFLFTTNLHVRGNFRIVNDIFFW
jgi:hypothetical protein